MFLPKKTEKKEGTSWKRVFGKPGSIAFDKERCFVYRGKMMNRDIRIAKKANQVATFLRGDGTGGNCIQDDEYRFLIGWQYFILVQ